MLFYVLIALMVLNAFTQEGVMAAECRDNSAICHTRKDWCHSDNEDQRQVMRDNCKKTCGF
ncbi:ShTK domain protein, partial [Trichostrongylus colubriformis]